MGPDGSDPLESVQKSTSSFLISTSTTCLWYRMSLRAVTASMFGARIRVGPKTMARFSAFIRLNFSFSATLQVEKEANSLNKQMNLRSNDSLHHRFKRPCWNHFPQTLKLRDGGGAHLFRCAMRYFKVSLCDGGSRARDSRKASSFFSGSVSSERTPTEQLMLEHTLRTSEAPWCCGPHVMLAIFKRALPFQQSRTPNGPFLADPRDLLAASMNLG